MNKLDRNCKNRLPQWQSEKMRSLIEERWSEVWEIVVARENSLESPHSYSKNYRRNSNF
ncbi:hypothetical protein [Pleurocapsa sp. CCALA 161]|uniref:hypothetical protein n=1 Tax=Pleurocapsa sp. CCALA 161 TaxID=2107688 RepID=UPI001304B437|nr:hypothetical protein [Pleurocapsa sp. CCALA 161]